MYHPRISARWIIGRILTKHCPVFPATLSPVHFPIIQHPASATSPATSVRSVMHFRRPRSSFRLNLLLRFAGSEYARPNSIENIRRAGLDAVDVFELGLDMLIISSCSNYLRGEIEDIRGFRIVAALLIFLRLVGLMKVGFIWRTFVFICQM